MRVFLLGCLFMVSGLRAQESPVIQLLDSITFKEAVWGKEVPLVDVRTYPEYMDGHIENAINIDYFLEDLFQWSFDHFKRSEPLYVYCGSGKRSHKAALKLAELGFKQIYELKNGYASWVQPN